MNISDFFPMWENLSESDKKILEEKATLKKAKKGTFLYDTGDSCSGLIFVSLGQIRAFYTSESGREITLYRLLEGDICIIKASCIINSLQIDINLFVEKDTEFFVLPTDSYKSLMDNSIEISRYTNEIIAGRMSDIVWLMDQIMWQSFDKRLAAFLLEESALDGSDTLHITHETIANHLGSAREVVTRMLKYFRSEGLIELSRGTLAIIDRDGLRAL